MIRPPPILTLFPYTTLFRSLERAGLVSGVRDAQRRPRRIEAKPLGEATAWLEKYRQYWESTYAGLDVLLEELKTDRKSTRLNSSHSQISYAVFCLKKKKK